MKQPECLHIPLLYEGENARIDWEMVDQADGVVIERTFNQTFEEALSGYSWENSDSLLKTWSGWDQEELSWKQIEARTGWGRSWEHLDYDGLSWSQIEAKDSTWTRFEHQDTGFEIFRGMGTKGLGSEQGRTWNELDASEKTWSRIEADNLSWTEWEYVTLSGLSWEGLDSRWQTFEECEGEDLTFEEWEALSSTGEHRAMTDSIPIGAVSAMYRIKSYSESEGVESSYLTTSQLPVIPIFYRSGTLEYPVKAGRNYRILLAAEDVYGLERVPMNVKYHPDVMELKNFSAISEDRIKGAGSYGEARLTIESKSAEGRIRFQSTRSLGQDQGFSGSIAIVELTAKRTGKATIVLS